MEDRRLSLMGSDRGNRRADVRLTVGQAIVRYLQAQHSERDGRTERLIPGVFGIFGHGNVAGLGEALDEYGYDLPFFQGRNEQSIVHTAAAFAKSTRRRSTLACTASIGPGSTNMITGAAGATISRLPVLLFPGDVYATRRQGPVLQQVEHPIEADVTVNDAFRGVSRFFDRIQRPEQLLTALPEAMRVLTSAAETGAVTIALPQDVQSEAFTYPLSFFESHTWRIDRPRPGSEAVRQAVGLLRRAERPLLIAGGGVLYSEAEDALTEFARTLGIPVAETFAGKGAVKVDDWFELGGIGVEGTSAANELARNADLVICVGTRLIDFTTGSQSLFEEESVQFVGINTCERDAHKQRGHALVGDARQVLIELTAAAAGLGTAEAYRDAAAAARREWNLARASMVDSSNGAGFTQAQLIAALNDEARDGDTVVAAAGTAPGDLLRLWATSGNRNCHINFGYSCMGYEIPGAIGVRMARRDGEVFALVGDGTFLMNPGDLAVAAQEGLKITVVIVENHGFQSIYRLQMLRSGRAFGNEFRRRDENGRLDGAYVDFDLAKVAEGLGVEAVRARSTDELCAALAAARAGSRASAIVCEVAPHQYLPPGDVWWDVAPAEVSGEQHVRERRLAYEEERANRQRYYASRSTR